MIDKSFLRSVEQLIRAVTGQNNFWNRIFLQLGTRGELHKIHWNNQSITWTNTWYLEIYRNKLKRLCTLFTFHKLHYKEVLSVCYSLLPTSYLDHVFVHFVWTRKWLLNLKKHHVHCWFLSVKDYLLIKTKLPDFGTFHLPLISH